MLLMCLYCKWFNPTTCVNMRTYLIQVVDFTLLGKIMTRPLCKIKNVKISFIFYKYLNFEFKK